MLRRLSQKKLRTLYLQRFAVNNIEYDKNKDFFSNLLTFHTLIVITN